MLGLWSRKTVEPAATAQAGAGEVAFTVENAAAVEATFADWKKRGLKILQEPVQSDFGTTFVATDPDGIVCACSFRRRHEPELGGDGFRRTCSHRSKQRLHAGLSRQGHAPARPAR